MQPAALASVTGSTASRTGTSPNQLSPTSQPTLVRQLLPHLGDLHPVRKTGGEAMGRAVLRQRGDRSSTLV
jgi:hypothetical protein